MAKPNITVEQISQDLWDSCNVWVCPQEPELELYGECMITFYCPCAECCGKSDGITASGVAAKADHTVAASLPFGTRLMIDGEEYVVEDRGVSGMCVDIFVNSHDEALQRGLYYTEVYIIND